MRVPSGQTPWPQRAALSSASSPAGRLAPEALSATKLARTPAGGADVRKKGGQSKPVWARGCLPTHRLPRTMSCINSLCNLGS